MKADPTDLVVLAITSAIAVGMMALQWELNNRPDHVQKSAKNIVSFALFGVSLMQLLTILKLGKWKTLQTTPPYRQAKHCAMTFSAIAMGLSLMSIGASWMGY